LKREKQIVVVVDENEYTTIVEKARKFGLTPASYLRMKALMD